MEMNQPKKIGVPVTDLHSETLLHTSFCRVFLYHASAKTLEFPVSIQATVQEVLEKIDQLQSSSSKAMWGVTFPGFSDEKMMRKVWRRFQMSKKYEKVGNILISDVFFLFAFRTSSWANVTDYRVDCND